MPTATSRRTTRRPGELLPAMMEHLEKVWQLPDDGIWEIRGPQRHFTQSKVMAWVAFDRAAKIAEKLGRTDLPIDRWRKLADQVKAEVCEKGFDKEKNSFVQYYGSDQLDSSLLMLARVGFLPPERSADHRHRRGDPARADGRRVRDALPDVRRRLGRRSPGRRGDVPPDDVLVGRQPRAHRPRATRRAQLFERLRGLQNDVGMFSEEYDPTTKRMIGNFPQAFSHLGLHRVGVAPLGRAPVAVLRGGDRVTMA